MTIIIQDFILCITARLTLLETTFPEKPTDKSEIHGRRRIWKSNSYNYHVLKNNVIHAQYNF